MNSTPAPSSARRTAKSLAAVRDVSFFESSARRIVATLRSDFRAKSSALQRRRARAALIWALESGLAILTQITAYATFHIMLGLSKQKLQSVASLRFIPERKSWKPSCPQSPTRAAAPSLADRMPGSSWAATKPPWSASGARNGARLNRRTYPATSSCSLAQRPRSSTAPGTSAIPAGRSGTCSAGSGIRRFPGWSPPSMG